MMGVGAIPETAKEWHHRYGRIREELTLNSRSIAALEADMEGLQKAGATAPQSNVAELALRIIAAERGLTA